MTVNPFRPTIAAIDSASRKRQWSVELLDRDERSLGFTSAANGSSAGVVGWSVEADANSQVGLSGSLQVRGDLVVGDTPVDWSIHRVRIWETIEGLGTWPLGVLLPALPSPRHEWRDSTWEVELVGKLRSIGRDRLTQSWVGGAGSVVTSSIGTWLDQLGEYNRAVTPSTATLPSSIVWSSGTSKLTMLNEMSAAIGYRGLRADPFGTILSAPYIAPGDRDVSWEFAADEASLLSPRWEEEWNLDSPNLFLARSQDMGEGLVLEAIAEDWDDSRPSSISRRGGQRVTEVEEGIEVASQAALQAWADRRLSELVSPAQRVTVSHLTLPTVDMEDGVEGLWVEDVVHHVRPGVDMRAVVEKMAWSSTSPLCTATWRRI